MKNLKDLICEIRCKYLWEKLNRHNRTKIGKNKNVCVLKLITNGQLKVGNETYGALNLDTAGRTEEGLQIGSYCSISSQSTFLLTGEHNTKTFSTFPFLEMRGGV